MFVEAMLFAWKRDSLSCCLFLSFLFDGIELLTCCIPWLLNKPRIGAYTALPEEDWRMGQLLCQGGRAGKNCSAHFKNYSYMIHLLVILTHVSVYDCQYCAFI